MTQHWSVHSGRNGYPTLTCTEASQICHLNSLYDPVREATELADSWQVSDSLDEITVVGLGLGYHIFACLEKYPWLRQITVLECHREVVNLATQWVPGLTEDPRIVIRYLENEAVFREAIGEADITNVYLHPASLSVFPFPGIRTLLQEIQMLRTTTSNQFGQLTENWLENLPAMHTGNILKGQRGSHSGRPGILVAAGPSLDDSVSLLQQVAPSATVVAVSAALKTLLNADVVPDYCIVSDSSKKIYDHFSKIENWPGTPELLMLATAFPGAANAWPGKVTWVLQQGFEPAESLAAQTGADLFATGGSVATLALSILYYLGCNPIVFVGQDLAYVNGRTHGQGIHSELAGTEPSLASSVTVRSVTGQPIQSNISWNSFRHWLESFIRDHPDRQYFNSSSGAHIEGTVAMRLPDVIRGSGSSSKGGN